jgi:hypothetical protein
MNNGGPTEVSEAIKPGDTYIADGDDYWTSGIDIGEHGNAVVCYARPESAAIALRDEVMAAMLAARTPTDTAATEVSEVRLFRHKKRGTVYELIGVGRAQGMLTDDDPVVLYRGEDGSLWARHQVEFSDGRFEEILSSRAPTDTVRGPVTCPRAIYPLRYCTDCPEGDECQLPRTPTEDDFALEAHEAEASFVMPTDTAPSEVERELREMGRAIRCGHVVTVKALVEDWKFSPDLIADTIANLRTAAPDDGLREVLVDDKLFQAAILAHNYLRYAQPLLCNNEPGAPSPEDIMEDLSEAIDERRNAAALKATPAPAPSSDLGQWRCVNCKAVTHSMTEPERCANCWWRAEFAQIAREEQGDRP